MLTLLTASPWFVCLSLMKYIVERYMHGMIRRWSSPTSTPRRDRSIFQDPDKPRYGRKASFSRRRL